MPVDIITLYSFSKNHNIFNMPFTQSLYLGLGQQLSKWYICTPWKLSVDWLVPASAHWTPPVFRQKGSSTIARLVVGRVDAASSVGGWGTTQEHSRRRKSMVSGSGRKNLSRVLLTRKRWSHPPCWFCSVLIWAFFHIPGAKCLSLCHTFC